MPCLRAGGTSLLFLRMEAPSLRGVESMPPPRSVLARGDSLPQTHAGMFRASAQRDRLKIFYGLLRRYCAEILAGRRALLIAIFTARRAQLAGDLHWMQSSIVQGAQVPHANPD